MSVIAEVRVRSTDFELGRIMQVKDTSYIELENLVPLGDATVPLFWIYNSTRAKFLETVRRHPAVSAIESIDEFEDRTLFTLEWDASHDHVLQGIQSHDGQILHARGTDTDWEFELRFPSHDALRAFGTHCEDAQVALEVVRVYNPTEPESGSLFGLTEPQYEAVSLAVAEGYYDIPRGCTTKELAEQLGISDQAVTERLRRAIVTLVESTLLVEE